MSFKGLNDGQRRAALIPFLEAADAFRAVTVVLAIDKRLRHFAAFPGFYDGLRERTIIHSNWRPHSFEHMVAVTHILSVLLGIVSQPGQSVTWISDADECFASDAHKKDCANLMSVFTSTYVKHALGELAVGTTDLDEGDRLEEDLTAIPDLAAGAVCELLHCMSVEYGKVPGVAAFVPPSVSRKTDVITSWFFAPNNFHQKIACVAQRVGSDQIQIGSMLIQDGGPGVTSLILPT